MHEFFSGGMTLEVTDGCFRLSTDSMALADFCRLPRAAAVCDLGCGCGALGLLRGYVLMMLLATMVPLVLNMLQIQLIHDLVDGSAFLKHFYPGNWFFGWIRSIL